MGEHKNVVRKTVGAPPPAKVNGSADPRSVAPPELKAQDHHLFCGFDFLQFA